MSNKISENTELTLDLKTLAIEVVVHSPTPSSVKTAALSKGEG